MSFAQQGNTVAIVAAVAPGPSPVQAPGYDSLQPMDYMVQAPSAGAFLVFGTTSAQAAANAGAVPGTTPQQGVPIPANYPLALRLAPGQWFTAITASGTIDVYVTPGAGDP